MCPVTNLSVACTSCDIADMWYLTGNGPCCVIVHCVKHYHICKYPHSQHLALKAYAASQECALYVVLSIWTLDLSLATLQCSTSLTHLACLDKLSSLIARHCWVCVSFESWEPRESICLSVASAVMFKGEFDCMWILVSYLKHPSVLLLQHQPKGGVGCRQWQYTHCTNMCHDSTLFSRHDKCAVMGPVVIVPSYTLIRLVGSILGSYQNSCCIFLWILFVRQVQFIDLSRSRKETIKTPSISC